MVVAHKCSAGQYVPIDFSFLKKGNYREPTKKETKSKRTNQKEKKRERSCYNFWNTRKSSLRQPTLDK